MTLMLLSGFTASCGLVPGASKDSPTQKPTENNAQSQAETTAQSQLPSANGALSIPPPVALPPSYGDRPNGNTATQAQTLPNGLPALQAKGVNVDELFAQNVANTDQRFDRLENAVLDLRREFESFKPAIVRLVAVEADIQDLIEQLDVLLQTDPAPAPVTQAPMPLKPAPQIEVQDTPEVEAEAEPQPSPTPAKAKPTVNTSGPVTVSSLRIGEHSDKLRLVMDVNKKTDFKFDLDNQERILIIELPNAQWSAAPQKSFGKSPLLNSYSTESINDGAGTRVIMTLKKSTTLMKSQALPPGSNPYYRIYADLKL